MEERLGAIGRLVEEERAHRRTQRRAIVILVISVVAGLGVLTYGLKEVARSRPAPAAVDYSNLPPIQRGPGQ